MKSLKTCFKGSVQTEHSVHKAQVKGKKFKHNEKTGERPCHISKGCIGYSYLSYSREHLRSMFSVVQTVAQEWNIYP